MTIPLEYIERALLNPLTWVAPFALSRYIAALEAAGITADQYRHWGVRVPTEEA